VAALIPTGAQNQVEADREGAHRRHLELSVTHGSVLAGNRTSSPASGPHPARRIERMVGGDRVQHGRHPAPARGFVQLAWGEQAQRTAPAREPSPLR